MRVGLQGWGSEGDLRPLIALAARLRRSGHEANLVLTPVDGKDYRPLCESLDVALKVVPERMAVTLQQLVRDAKSKNPTKLSNAVLDLTFYPYIEAMYAASLDLCASSDVVVGGSSCWQLKAASLNAKVPFVALDFVPGIVPSREVPPAIFPSWPWLARPAWALLGVMFDMAFREAPRVFFAEKGLPPIRHTIPDVIFSDHLNLHASGSRRRSGRSGSSAAPWRVESQTTSGSMLAHDEIRLKTEERLDERHRGKSISFVVVIEEASFRNIRRTIHRSVATRLYPAASGSCAAGPCRSGAPMLRSHGPALGNRRLSGRSAQELARMQMRTMGAMTWNAPPALAADATTAPERSMKMPA
jgi:hypothetical protein